MVVEAILIFFTILSYLHCSSDEFVFLVVVQVHNHPFLLLCKQFAYFWGWNLHLFIQTCGSIFWPQANLNEFFNEANHYFDCFYFCFGQTLYVFGPSMKPFLHFYTLLALMFPETDFQYKEEIRSFTMLFLVSVASFVS